MTDLLAMFEQQCWLSREGQPDLECSVTKAYRVLGRRPSAAFGKVQERLIALLESDAQAKEHPYHNRHHVCDVVAAAALLLHVHGADRAGDDTIDAVLTAALAHDLHHDGRATSIDGALEERSAAAVKRVGTDSGLEEKVLDLMEGLILSTPPSVQARLRARLREGNACGTQENFQLLLGEADVLASLTPHFGWRLSALLREEWSEAGFQPANPPDTPKGRRFFLGTYTTLSLAACKLGVDRMIAAQLEQLDEERT